MTATSKICEFRGRYIYVKAKEEFMGLNMKELEKSLVVAVTSAKSEEQTYADDLYRHVDIEKKEIEKAMPYPRTGEYDTGIDYEDIERIEYEKGANKPQNRENRTSVIDVRSVLFRSFKLFGTEIRNFALSLSPPHIPSTDFFPSRLIPIAM